MIFLKAEWRKLIIANYTIDPKFLKDYLPIGTELDLWDEKCYVSLVGFMFQNTKVLGLKIPFHINFEEVNLRFYVKKRVDGEWRRGVVFVKELVPKLAISTIANFLYKEHYETCKMQHSWLVEKNNLQVQYQWKKSDKWNSISVDAKNELGNIIEGSEAEFITEHYFGYTKVSDMKTYEYEVGHPRWQQYSISNCEIDIDYGLTYGSHWSFLNDIEVQSVFLAEGSVITVGNKKTMRL